MMVGKTDYCIAHRAASLLYIVFSTDWGHLICLHKERNKRGGASQGNAGKKGSYVGDAWATPSAPAPPIFQNFPLSL